MRTRQQFGRPLSANQGVQFSVTDMAVKLHMARLTVRHAAAMLDGSHPAAPGFAAVAKRSATELGFEVVDAALQLHGGYGYLRAFPLERFLRDVRVHRILEGTNEIMSVLISRAVLGDD